MSDQVNSSTTASINYPHGSYQAQIVSATEGSDGINLGKFYGESDYVTYDPGFLNTAATKSAITYIDGEKGILRYRGYPIEQLANSSTFLEVSYLLIYGQLPTQSKLDDFVSTITHHTMLHEDLRRFF